MEKILDYKIAVEGKRVDLTILHQSPIVRPFFNSEMKKFGKFKISDRGCLSLIGYDLFLIGTSDNRNTNHYCSSTSQAFRYAAELAEALELMCEDISKIPALKINYVSKFLDKGVYLNTKTGQIGIPVSNYGIWRGYDFITNRYENMPFKKNEWVLIGSWTSVATIFGTSITTDSVLKKYKSLNESGIKQIWHK